MSSSAPGGGVGDGNNRKRPRFRIVDDELGLPDVPAESPVEMTSSSSSVKKNLQTAEKSQKQSELEKTVFRDSRGRRIPSSNEGSKQEPPKRTEELRSPAAYKKDQSSSNSNQRTRISENRFSLPAGPKWDGVDRSNGFEKRWFRAQSSMQSHKQREYEDDTRYL